MKSKRAGKRPKRFGEHIGATPTRGSPRFTESETKNKKKKNK